MELLNQADSFLLADTKLSQDWKTRLNAVIFASKSGIYGAKGMAQESIFWATKFIELLITIFYPADCLVTMCHLVIEVVGKFQHYDLLQQLVAIYHAHTIPEKGCKITFKKNPLINYF